MTYTDFPAELVTERLRLRRWVPSDAVEYRGLWLERDPRSVRRINAEGRPTVDDLHQRLVENPRMAEPGLGLLVIEELHSGAFLGYAGLTVGNATLDEPELVYELARHAHRHGYATEAACAIVEAAQRTGRGRLWATVREWNAPSFRVLEKVGFVRSDRITPDPDRGDSIWMTRELS